MKVSATTVRYIKLGAGGRWENSLDRAELHFGYGSVTHELAREGNRAKIITHLIALGRSPQAAARDAQEVADFYDLDEACLWITFARDHLWWTFAEPEVTWVKPDPARAGERFRKAIGGWCNTDVNGTPLKINSLSTKLTKVASYRRTICAVKAHDYLLRRINGIEEPIVAKASQIRTALIEVTIEALRLLHWADFETLVDIIFARSGWNRVSMLGGTKKLVDLELEHPVINERAAVQVKSAANQKTLDAYIRRTDAAEQFDRFFFICHSPKGALSAPDDRADIHVWTGRELGATIMRLGLHDWVMERLA
ncbi:hypothetical protein [Bradyrhizobium zhanjiangense]|uniref:Restriction endonuclease type IV Mrr domain-containing protein n=1 Tax=Bradyrhizobium zhanjiangense TaxID=1325107 RepID=A0A4Q0SPN7_9BRAD|nr:hypothetical protein [Bradyrhizobium zhanjiangense]RXH41895.1 hypothetical protein XH94_04350 [Bradyrhizobium zhanjiangense]